MCAWRGIADDDVLRPPHPHPTLATLSSPTPTLISPLHLETALQVRNEPYNVTAGSLGFGIMIFSIFAVVAIVLLRVRRYQGGELGGEKQGQWVTFGLLFTLWLLFLTLTGLLDYQHIQSSGI